MQEEKINDSSVELSDEDLSNTTGGVVKTSYFLEGSGAVGNGYRVIGKTDEEQAVAAKAILKNLPVELQKNVINQLYGQDVATQLYGQQDVMPFAGLELKILR